MNGFSLCQYSDFFPLFFSNLIQQLAWVYQSFARVCKQSEAYGLHFLPASRNVGAMWWWWRAAGVGVGSRNVFCWSWERHISEMATELQTSQREAQSQVLFTCLCLKFLVKRKHL